MDAAEIEPYVTWGNSPEDALPIGADVPRPEDVADEGKRKNVERALGYMGLTAGMKIADIKVDTVFIGSCTNGRIEDIRAAAAVAKGRKVADGIRALVVPGSGLVKNQAEEEGLDRILVEASFEWREAGCSMCLARSEEHTSELQSIMRISYAVF